MRNLTLGLVLAFSASATSQGWVDVTPVPVGPSSQDGVMCYDPVHGVTWLFTSSGTYSWDGQSWAPGGPGLSTPRHATWDPLAQRVVLAAVVPVSGAWAFRSWDGSTLTTLPAPNLAVGSHSGLCFDEANGKLVLIASNTTATFDGTSWDYPSIAVQPTLSGPSLDPSLFYDPTRSRVALVMQVQTGSQFFPQYWEWTGTNWVQRFPASPIAGLGAIADARGRGFSAAVLFPQTSVPHMFAIANGQIDEMFLTDWPATRRSHLLAYDSGRDRFVLHGGTNPWTGTFFRDTWELDLGPNATYTTYGAGCPGSGGTPTLSAQFGSLPSVNTTFNVQVNGLPWTGPSFMWLGFSNQQYAGIPLPVNLAILGAPQCNVLVSPDLLFGIPNVLGTSFWSLAIPNLPGWTFYNQAVAFDAQANALGLVFSNAGAGIVGQ